jgi:hypothetical protein
MTKRYFATENVLWADFRPRTSGFSASRSCQGLGVGPADAPQKQGNAGMSLGLLPILGTAQVLYLLLPQFPTGTPPLV